jgi:hypothetical protein
MEVAVIYDTRNRDWLADSEDWSAFYVAERKPGRDH